MFHGAETAVPLRIARVGRGVAASAVALALVLVSRGGIEDSERVFAAVVAARDFRTIEPRLSVGLPYRPFRHFESRNVTEQLAHLPTSVARRVANWVDIGQASPPEAIHRAAVVQLLFGNWETALQLFSRNTPTAGGVDAASAYFMRGMATRSLRDFEQVLQLLDDAKPTPAVLFNRALTLEALCDRHAAAAEWRRYLAIDGTSDWAAEARRHLEMDSQPSASMRWLADKPRLVAAAVAGDAARLEPVIDAHRASARRLVELELLPSWAEAWSRGDRAEAGRMLSAGGLISSILRRLTGESLMSDAIVEIDRVKSDEIVAPRFAAAYLAYGRGRRAIDATDYGRAAAELAQAKAAVPPASAAAALFAVSTITVRYYRYEYDEAEDLIDSTERIFANSADRYIALFGHLAWLRGLVLVNRGDASGALRRYEQALQTFERLGELDPQAAQHTNIADALEILGDTTRAAAHRYEALTIAERLDETRRLHPILSESADAALASSFPAAALSFQNRLVTLSRQSGNALRVADSLVIRSTILRQVGRRSEALHDLDEASRVIEQIADAPSRNRLFADAAAAEAFAYEGADDERAIRSLTRSIELFQRLQSTFRLAQLFLERGRIRMRRGDGAGAEADFRAGIADLENRRRNVKEAELRISYFDRAETLFTDLATSLLRRGLAEEAFDLLERGRARELLDVTSRSWTEPLPLRTIQRRLGRDTLLITLTATASKVIICVVGTKTFRVVEQPFTSSQLAADAGAVADGFKTGELPERELQRLGKILIDPIELPAGARVIFVPDPLFCRIPFAALPEQGRYLIENRIVQVAPSATLAVQISPVEEHQFSSILLLASSEAPGAYPSLQPLEQTIGEAKSIAPLYPKHLLLLGSDARAKALLRIGRDYDVINFGGHAIVDDRKPSASSLLIGRNGALHAADIEACRLPRTRLVVLGACSTGVGEAHRGEGALSLARAFMAAGVPAVVNTIGPVEDRAGAMLLTAFHKAYVSGFDPAAALRIAQLRLLHDPDPSLNAAAAWAAFQVVGFECRSQMNAGERTL